MAYSCKIWLRDAPGLPRTRGGPFACGEMDDPFATDVMDVDGER